MTLPARRVHFTEEEYLAHEAGSSTRHEFYDGEVYAMAGAKGSHNVICGNAIRVLGNLVHGRSCRVFTSDQRIHVPATGLYTYADGGVACGRWQIHKDGMCLLNPTLLFEVLSPSTAEYDRGTKVDHYRQIPSLKDVLIIDQPGHLIEHHHRAEDGLWRMTSSRTGEIRLALDGTMLISDLYHLSDLDEEPAV